MSNFCISNSSETLIFRLVKVALIQGVNVIYLHLPLEVLMQETFLRPLVSDDVEIRIIGQFDFVPLDSISSLNKPVE